MSQDLWVHGIDTGASLPEVLLHCDGRLGPRHCAISSSLSACRPGSPAWNLASNGARNASPPAPPQAGCSVRESFVGGAPKYRSSSPPNGGCVGDGRANF